MIEFRTGRRAGWSAPSARFVGLAIAERRDLEQARRRGKKPPERSKSTWLPPGLVEAQLWARRVGFTADEIPRAATVALFLRSVQGAGNVTVDQVRARIGGGRG